MACGSAAELQARLAFRALFPLVPRRSETSCDLEKGGASQPSRNAIALKAGLHIMVGEDFISDSGQQDKVQLLHGQRGVVIKISDAGHASIDFDDHQKLQWVMTRHFHKLHIEDNDEQLHSSLRQSILNDISDAMGISLQRRIGRLHKVFQVLKNCDTDGCTAFALPEHKSSFSTDSLSAALAQVLRSRPLPKSYGPSETQEQLEDPPETRQRIVPETETLELTLQCLEDLTKNRNRQVRSLWQQVDTCQTMCHDMENSLEAVHARERALREDPTRAQAAHAESLRGRRERVQELTSALEETRDQAKWLESLYRHQQRYIQQRYILQTERISMGGLQSTAMNHASGDLALVPQPLPLGDEQHGHKSWDVGTAVANPYIVDSWPFEPNVLAHRTFQQACPMDPWKEETQRDLQNEERRLPNLIPNLRLPMGGGGSSDEDENENGYGGKTGTSRSL